MSRVLGTQTTLRRLVTHRALLAMLVLLFFLPVFRDSTYGRVVFQLTLGLTLVVAVLTVYEHGRHRALGLLLAVLALCARVWENLSLGNAGSLIAAELSAALFLTYTALGIFKDLVSTREVDGDTLASAVTLYLLVGFIFAMIFASIETLLPGSFTFPADLHATSGFVDTRRFFYFSFVTLTTIGYGDMVPVSDAARSVALTEAIVGQMFIAIILGSLISRQR